MAAEKTIHCQKTTSAFRSEGTLGGTQPNSTLAGLNRSILIIICERKFLLTLSTPSKRRVSAFKADYTHMWQNEIEKNPFGVFSSLS